MTNIYSNTKQSKKIKKLLVPLILLICGYQMDINKNYKTFLDNDMVLEYLKNYKADDEIIKYVKEKFNFNGKIIYLRNFANAECMIYYNDNECYLVFIGTQFNFNDKVSMCKDLWTDICLGLSSIDFLNPKIKMHSKYICNMNDKNLMSRISKYVEKLGFKNITICGHSMGCGLGMYTSIVLTRQFTNKKFNLITFDSPKIGNEELNKYVKQINNLNQLDIVNNKDIIPLFPFIFPNYLHIANKTLILQTDGNVEICKNLNKKINIFTNNSINDHFTNNILSNVYKCIISL